VVVSRNDRNQTVPIPQFAGLETVRTAYLRYCIVIRRRGQQLYAGNDRVVIEETCRVDAVTVARESNVNVEALSVCSHDAI